jgi:hypothetical protein
MSGGTKKNHGKLQPLQDNISSRASPAKGSSTYPTGAPLKNKFKKIYICEFNLPTFISR